MRYNSRSIRVCGSSLFGKTPKGLKADFRSSLNSSPPQKPCERRVFSSDARGIPYEREKPKGDAERWRRIKNLFQAALERAPDERARFLDEACAEDRTLRAEVDQLLAADSRSDSFLKSPALGEAVSNLVKENAEEDRASLEGDWLGPYLIIKRLGAGGMGEVYLAEDTRLGRRVALKLLPAEFSKDEERVRRFAREARAASALNHPHITTVHEIAHVNGRHFIVTEYVEGETLRERIKRGRFEISEAVEIAAQIASALAKAHAAGIIHRDIKPENIMLRPDGYAKALDFGLAKLVERQNATLGAEDPTRLRVNTNPGVVMGTVSYMSPEQLRGQETDARTDVWSLGVTLYEMLCARVPFQGATTDEAIAAILKSEPSLDAIDCDAADDARRIIGKALQKDRSERYESAAAMSLDLKSLKQELNQTTGDWHR